MEILIFAILLGLIPAVIAKNKGRAFFPWWVYGVFLFIIALVHALLLKRGIGQTARGPSFPEASTPGKGRRILTWVAALPKVA
jgi:membrane protein implicated in regulation of membrane protease activity